MELQIQDLVSSIRKDGIETAGKEADAIVSDAKKQAAEIVAEARAEAAKMKEAAEKEIAVYKESAQLGAQQAKRDAMLAFKTEVQGEFEKILSADVAKTLNQQTLAKLITAALNGEDAASYTAEVSEVGEALKAELADAIRNGLEIRPSKSVRSGFRLAANDGSGYFDCSEEEITEMLKPFFRDIAL